MYSWALQAILLRKSGSLAKKNQLSTGTFWANSESGYSSLAPSFCLETDRTVVVVVVVDAATRSRTGRVVSFGQMLDEDEKERKGESEKGSGASRNRLNSDILGDLKEESLGVVSGMCRDAHSWNDGPKAVERFSNRAKDGVGVGSGSAVACGCVSRRRSYYVQPIVITQIRLPVGYC